MSAETDNLLRDTQANMDKAIEHLNLELSKIRAGKASPSMLDNVYVDYYGASTPISQVGAVNTPDARTLVIQPWEKSLLTPIEKAISFANLGLNPTNDGTVIRIIIPPLTEERRKQLVKMCKEQSEHSKVAIRGIRKDTNEAVKKFVKGGLPEDEGKVVETKIQESTDKFIIKVDQLVAAKEKEILTV